VLVLGGVLIIAPSILNEKTKILKFDIKKLLSNLKLQILDFYRFKILQYNITKKSC